MGQPMKVAVTGATGFIGSALVKRLCDSGHQVLALVRHPQAAADRFPRGVKLDRFDAGEPPARGLLLGYDAVIHLAGAPLAERWSDSYKQRILKSRQQGTEAIARACVDGATVKVLLSASAIGYYGPHGAEELVETSGAGNDFLAEVCRAWEKAAVAARAAGIRTVHPRMGMVLHPSGGALKKLLPVFKAGAGGRLGSGQQYVSWIHLEDVLSALLFLLETRALEGPVNLTAPAPVTNAELTRTLARVLHRPALFAAPGFALRLAMGEMADMVLTGQRVIPRRLLEAGFTFRYPELGAALESFRPRADRA